LGEEDAMSVMHWVVAGGILVGMVGIFVLFVRDQLIHERAIKAMLKMNSDLMTQHDTVLEHLMIASDPDAWREKQVDKYRKERDAKREQDAASDGEPLPPKKGVG
jgi:hypothetical protein